MIAACVLLCLGEATSPDQAIKLVRLRRCQAAIETSRQEQHVHSYAAYLKTQKIVGDEPGSLHHQFGNDDS
jgi:hypothetical protein